MELLQEIEEYYKLHKLKQEEEEEKRKKTLYKPRKATIERIKKQDKMDYKVSWFVTILFKANYNKAYILGEICGIEREPSEIEENAKKELIEAIFESIENADIKTHPYHYFPQDFKLYTDRVRMITKGEDISKCVFLTKDEIEEISKIYKTLAKDVVKFLFGNDEKLILNIYRYMFDVFNSKKTSFDYITPYLNIERIKILNLSEETLTELKQLCHKLYQESKKINSYSIWREIDENEEKFKSFLYLLNSKEKEEIKERFYKIIRKRFEFIKQQKSNSEIALQLKNRLEKIMNI